MKIVVTGATGYIGSRFVDICVARGQQIVALSHRKLTNYPYEWLPFDLRSAGEITLPVETDMVVHLAANTSMETSISKEQEFSTTLALLLASKKVSAKFVFVSSQTASPTAPTPYGRT
ncbi:MAG: NAD(P)-dependent oxidoreductase, partial [Nitrospinae bacterium]|nr:NAD(P)-dependent oxidoreductase [Nitrospinota bacterium]